MKNRILAIIAICSMSAASGLHAMAGYAPHLDIQKTNIKPIGYYVSSMLPPGIRASKEYRDELFHMHEATKNSAFVICRKKKLSEKALADARSVGFSNLHYAVIRLDEDKMKYQSPSCNTTALAHELRHAHNNDDGELNAWRRLSLILPFSRYAKAQYDTLNKHYQENKFEINSGYEYRAEKEAYETMALCGYRKALERQANHYSRNYESHERPYSEIYPTAGTYAALAENALKNCRTDINPKYTQDSPRLMRNTPEPSFFARLWNTMFGSYNTMVS